MTKIKVLTMFKNTEQEKLCCNCLVLISQTYNQSKYFWTKKRGKTILYTIIILKLYN